MTISWVILTFNRADIVKKSVLHNMRTAGDTWDEIVWCDNGSTDGVRDFMMHYADVGVLHKTNLGVAKGYNAALGMARKDYIVITGSDMLMPEGWLCHFKEYVRRIPNTGVACIYSKPLALCPERVRGPAQIVNSLPLVPALAIERRIFKRSLLSDIGYFPEEFGKYGFDDVCWAERAEIVAREKGLINYVIPTMIAEHLGTEGVARHNGKDAADYHAMKRKEVFDPDKSVAFAKRREAGWPRFGPYL